ncbi:phosphate ABC transporter permease subunit PstC [bacterium]
MKKFIKVKEEIYKYIFASMAFASLIFLVGIVIVLFKEGLPVFKHVKLFSFFFGKYWYPTFEPPEFGIFPLIMGSLWITVGALFICVPFGLGSALYMHELASYRQRSILKPVIEILAGVPSIIYGFFGMVFVAPLLQKIFNIPTGLCVLTASLILGVMAIPTVFSISEDALGYVPKSLKEASLALGATRWQTLTRIVIPAAGSGISTSIILGVSRIIGETMTVLMIAGGAAVVPNSFLKPVRPMTATIAAEMGEAVMGSDHYHALFAIGLVLFFITLIFNTLSEMISRKYRLKLGAGR